MKTESFFVAGTPATFATRGEIPWRETVAKHAPAPCLGGTEVGISLDFSLETLTRRTRPFDIDNLCEPVLYALVGRRSWFQGKRPRISWLRATKCIGKPTGCLVSISCGCAPDFPTAAPDLVGHYTGAMPTSAKSLELAKWASDLRQSRGVSWFPTTCRLCLEFLGGKPNLGDISTGVVKSFIDCLYPWLGGVERSPEDHRIRELMVLKGRTAGAGVLVNFWADSRLP